MPRLAPDLPDTVRKGLIITALGGLMYTFDLPLIRLAAQAGGETWTLIFARGLFIFLAVSLSWGILKGGSPRGAMFGGLAGLGVVITNTIAPITYVSAVQLTGAANVVFILALIPVASAILSMIFLRERMHAYTWAASICCFAGISVVVGDSLSFGNERLLGDILAVVSCLCTAATLTIIRGYGESLVGPLALGSLCSATIAFMMSGNTIETMAATGWMWIGLCGLFVIPVATVLLAHGPRYLPSVDVSMFFLLETSITPVWIYLIFGEAPGSRGFVGGAIVIVTLLLHSAWRIHSTLGNPGGIAK